MSSILSKIKTGRLSSPQKIVIYGPQKIGKSTLASLFPSPLFLDTEHGSGLMEVSRLDTSRLSDFDGAVAELAKSTPADTGYYTVVVDTIDWLESRIKEEVINTVSMKDRAFGREGSFICDKLVPRLSALTALLARGYHVVLLAHSAVVKIDLPDQPSAYDRYELDMEKKHCAPMIKHWADHLLFCKWKVAVREPDEGRNKGVGKGERLLCFTQSAAYDAGSRSSITGEHLMEFPPSDKLLRRMIEDVGAAWGSVPVPAKATSTEPGKSAAGANAALLKDATGSALNAAVAASAENTPSTATASPSDLPRSADPIPGIEQAEAEDEELAKVIGPQEAVVNACLIKDRHITADQSYRSCPPAVRARILKNPSGFLNYALKSGKGAA